MFADLFFCGGGMPRLQLWFDNPNKAAVLFGSLALVFVILAFRTRRRPAVAAFALSSFLGVCGLLLTYSRGGLVAFAVGLSAVLWTFRCRLLKPFVLSLLAAGLVLSVVAFCFRGKGIVPTDDASVVNRLEIWRTVPQMMADSMTGWGVGNAGDAYMGWYQPLQSYERYRTLVSSHLTWLVELGLWGRVGYCFGWLLMLGICLRRWRRKDDPLPFAVWISFGIAGMFSSVAEAPVLWIVPAVVAIPAVVDFVRAFERRDCQALLWASAVWGLLLPMGLVWFGSGRIDRRIELFDDVLTYGAERSATWIVKDLAVMGGGAYGRDLRMYEQQATNVTCGVVAGLSDVPSDVRRLVLCGKAADVDAGQLAAFGSLEEIRVLSPSCPENWLDATSAVPVSVFCGEFSATCPAKDHPRLKVVPGNGVYLTHWPELALSASRLISAAENLKIHTH